MAVMKPRHAAALAMLLLLSGGCRFFRHNPITVSGTIHPAFTANCTGGTFAHARFFIAVPTASIRVVLAARGRQLAIPLDLRRTPTFSVLLMKEQLPVSASILPLFRMPST